MRKKLRDLLAFRLEDELAPQNPLTFLKRFSVEDYLDTIISIVYLYTRPRKGTAKTSVYFAEIISAIGHQVRNKLKQKKDSALAAKTGAFILYSIEQLGLVEVLLGQGNKGHASYIVNITNDDEICELWAKVDPNKVEKLPSIVPHTPWTSSRHPTGASLVKTGNKGVLESLTPETHPIVFECINRAQSQGWQVNEDVYRVSLWALRNRTEAFADVWEQSNPEARATKLREVKTIGDVAKRFIGKIFYHLYYYDFRGRKYPTTAFLHEQGSDLARGLLLRSDKKAIGKTGFFWLMVSIASNWGGDAGREDGLKTDKLPLAERFAWAMDNEELFLSYASSPKIHQAWMQADKTWQFLAACIELMKLRTWQYEEGLKTDTTSFENYEYESHLEVYIDGSNNGSQHLAALTKDEVTAPHVNLVPQALPGDLYKYVGDHVWARLKKQVAALDSETLEDCERYIDTLIDMKKKIMESPPKSELRQTLVGTIQSYKEENMLLGILSSPVYWLRIKDPKHRRKIVKRNVMTLPYGGTAYGLG